MFSHVMALTCPKSEHTIASNEDVFVVLPDVGVFALSDGVGSMLYSRLWAQTIVQYFSEIPLQTSDAFELEWWMVEARRRFEKQVPPIADLAWNARRKAMEGSAATLAAVSVIAENNSDLRLRVSEIGDTCAFVAFGEGERVQVRAGWREVVEVGRAPVCLGSVERKFDRGYQVCEGREVVVRGDQDVVVLATDEVARWILRQGEVSWWGAVQEIARMTPETWASFIVGCRSRGEMEDDDATVLVLRPTVRRSGVWVAVTPPHGVEVVQERLRALEQARGAGEKERVAILYGDGRDCKRARVPREEIADARAVADALNVVRQAYWATLGRADAAARIRQAWLTQEAVLGRSENRVSVEKMLTLLHANGMLAEIVLPAVSEPVSDEPVFLYWLNRLFRALMALAPRSGGGTTSW